jgi:hypothetical protein
MWFFMHRLNFINYRWKVKNTADFLTTIRENIGLEAGNAYEEVNTLFESVFRIYEQQHNEVDYSCLDNFYLNYNYLYIITKLFFL